MTKVEKEQLMKAEQEKKVAAALKKLAAATETKVYFNEYLTAEASLQMLALFNKHNKVDLNHPSAFKEDKVGIYLSSDNVMVMEDMLEPFLTDPDEIIARYTEEKRTVFTNSGYLVEKDLLAELMLLAGREANDVAAVAGKRKPRG